MFAGTDVSIAFSLQFDLAIFVILREAYHVGLHVDCRLATEFVQNGLDDAAHDFGHVGLGALEVRDRILEVLARALVLRFIEGHHAHFLVDVDAEQRAQPVDRLDEAAGGVQRGALGRLANGARRLASIAGIGQVRGGQDLLLVALGMVQVLLGGLLHRRGWIQALRLVFLGHVADFGNGNFVLQAVQG